MNEPTIRALFGLLLLFALLRVYFFRKARREGGEIEFREKNLTALNIVRGIGAVILLGSIILYFIQPAWLAWATIPLPEWARWAGIIAGYPALVFMWWAQWALGNNFHTTLH